MRYRQTRGAVLRDARKLIQRVAEGTDNTFTICECCEAKRYNNWPDRQLYLVLEGMLTKLERVVGTDVCLKDV